MGEHIVFTVAEKDEMVAFEPAREGGVLEQLILVVALRRSGKLIYTNAYYYIGHFSKFVRPGARRIATASSRDVLQTTAFLNPDGKVAVVVMNQTDQEQPFQLWLKGQAAQATSRPHSIMTMVVN